MSHSFNWALINGLMVYRHSAWKANEHKPLEQMSATYQNYWRRDADWDLVDITGTITLPPLCLSNVTATNMRMGNPIFI